jgi:hypothetical protein
MFLSAQCVLGSVQLVQRPMKVMAAACQVLVPLLLELQGVQCASKVLMACLNLNAMALAVVCGCRRICSM